MYYLSKILKEFCHVIDGCQDVVGICQDLAMAAKMLVRGSTRDHIFYVEPSNPQHLVNV